MSEASDATGVFSFAKWKARPRFCHVCVPGISASTMPTGDMSVTWRRRSGGELDIQELFVVIWNGMEFFCWNMSKTF